MKYVIWSLWYISWFAKTCISQFCQIDRGNLFYPVCFKF